VIKLVFCLRKLPSFSGDEFQAYWRERHAPLVRKMAPALGILRYTQSHGFWDSRLTASANARQCTVIAYDGVAELWWNSLDHLISVGSMPAAREAGRLLLEEERKFIDLPNSPLFFTEEHEIFVA
jgi:uncharacterized protein (TIGR02118 family)